jgi:hypothetical protein
MATRSAGWGPGRVGDDQPSDNDMDSQNPRGVSGRAPTGGTAKEGQTWDLARATSESDEALHGRGTLGRGPSRCAHQQSLAFGFQTSHRPSACRVEFDVAAVSPIHTFGSSNNDCVAGNVRAANKISTPIPP